MNYQHKSHKKRKKQIMSLIPLIVRYGFYYIIINFTFLKYDDVSTHWHCVIVLCQYKYYTHIGYIPVISFFSLNSIWQKKLLASGSATC